MRRYAFIALSVLLSTTGAFAEDWHFIGRFNDEGGRADVYYAPSSIRTWHGFRIIDVWVVLGEVSADLNQGFGSIKQRYAFDCEQRTARELYNFMYADRLGLIPTVHGKIPLENIGDKEMLEDLKNPYEKPSSVDQGWMLFNISEFNLACNGH